MKHFFLTVIITLLFVIPAVSQVGINTQNPLGIFHVDPKNNTVSTTASTYVDDILVSNNGLAGMGVLSPDALLHIRTSGTSISPVSGLRLVDGNEGDGRVLTVVNNTGLVTWQAVTEYDQVYFNRPSYCPSRSVRESSFNYTNAHIDLPPGRWVVMANMYAHIPDAASTGEIVSVNSTFSNNVSSGAFNSIVSSDIEGGAFISGAVKVKGIVTGAVVINNKLPYTKTYYYMVGGLSSTSSTSTTMLRSFGGQWGEDTIVAFRIPSDV